MSCEESIRALLARIDQREDEIHAWVYLEREGALARARLLDAAPARGPLHGMGIGVKDVIATADMPTQYNSPIYAGHRPAEDAEVVRRLKAAGAVILGKTVTTEFAYMAPGTTRNPHNLACTPGGSSSGSAAAVACNMVPVALATQTGGSTIRPAAFCGVFGYKPAFGSYPTRGLKMLSPALDTIGLHAQNLDDLAAVSAVLAGVPMRIEAAPARLCFAMTGTHNAAQAEPQQLARLEEAGRALARAGAEVRTVELPPMMAELDALHRVVMAFEVARSLAPEWAGERARLSADLANFIEKGLTYSKAEVDAARVRVDEGRRVMAAFLAPGEVLLTPPAAGEAPLGLDSTGNAAFNRLWTLLGPPCLSLPAGRGVRGLPLGVQLVGVGMTTQDEPRFLAIARWARAALDQAGLGQ